MQFPIFANFSGIFPSPKRPQSRAKSPVSCEKNLFSKGHEQVRSMLFCQRGPGDKKMMDENMSETTANDKEKNPGPVGPGEPGTGPEIPAADEKTIAVHKKTVPCQVERVTALRAQSIARPRQPKNVLRRQSQYDIYGKDPEIPYVKFEAAARDLVCSLMERQDRMNEAIFSRINDITDRVEGLEGPKPRGTGT